MPPGAGAGHLRYLAPMTSLTDRASTWLRATTTASNLVADEAMMGNLRRLRWLVLVIIPLALIHVAVFWWDVSGVTPAQLAWKNAIGWTHLCMALWLVLLGLAAHWLSRQATPNVGARMLQFAAPLGFMFFTTALAVIDQWVTPNISPFLLGSVFTSLLFLMRPLSALMVFLAVYVLFYFGLGITQQDPVQLLSNRANGLASVVMGVVLSMVLWHKNTVYVLLQRELISRNATLMQQQQELIWLAQRDALTGLFNRGEFLRLADLELLRAQRHGTDTSAIMVDLDFFKNINDRYGHPAGDSVLKHAAACLLGGVRGTDVVARIGGEEFMVLLPQTAPGAAYTLAEKLLRSMQQSSARISSEVQIVVTASFGVGTLPGGHHGSVALLYAAADHALYEAKRLGRNRVEKTEPDASLTPSDFQRMRRR